MRRHEFAISDRESLIDILRSSCICRIAIHDKPYPYLVPLNFGLEESPQLTLYFHCAPEGKKLDLIRKNNRVCFEVEANARVVTGEKPCQWTMHYRSVIGYGKLKIIDDEAGICHGLNVLMKHHGYDRSAGYDRKLLERTRILQLTVENLLGKHHGPDR